MNRAHWVGLLALGIVCGGMALAATLGGAVLAQGDETPGLIVYASDKTGNYEIFVLDPETGLGTQLTNDPGTDIEPVWSPEGDFVAFVSNRDGDFELFVMRADGTDVRQLTLNNAEDRQPHWQPGGHYIVFVSNLNGQFDLFAISADGAMVRQLTNDSFDERGPGMAAVQVEPGAGPGPIPIQEATPGSQETPVPDAVVTSRELNVRNNPGEGARILEVLPQNTPLRVIGRYSDNSWVQVATPSNTTGWVLVKLLQLNIDLANVPVVNAPFILPPTATPQPTDTPIVPTAVPTTIAFWVDRAEINAGECVNVSWKVEGIKAVYYQGNGVGGEATVKECPTATTTYSLRVVLLDDSVDNRYMTVTVH